jgi:hypothetical protein
MPALVFLMGQPFVSKQAGSLILRMSLDFSAKNTRLTQHREVESIAVNVDIKRLLSTPGA